jgi:hypothetical protein
MSDSASLRSPSRCSAAFGGRGDWPQPTLARPVQCAANCCTYLKVGDRGADDVEQRQAIEAPPVCRTRSPP